MSVASPRGGGAAAGAPPEIEFRAKGLVRSYRIRTGWRSSVSRHAVSGVDLDLVGGRHLAVVGESGSGKSTLVRLLLGLEAPDAGEITFAGRAVQVGAPLGWLRREVQFVSQDPGSSLDPRMSVGDSVREPLECLGIGGDHDARVSELFAAVGLDPASTARRPEAFSGGQRQRIALARALAPRPSVLIADEPFSAVDAAARVALVGLIRRIAGEHGLTLLLVSHDLGLVARLCHDVAVLDRGRVAEAGPVEQVLVRPRAPATRRLIEATPVLPDRRDAPRSVTTSTIRSDA